MILDLSNPARPEEISRWWLPGSGSAEAKSRLGKARPTTAITL